MSAIDSMTIKEAKELAQMFGAKSCKPVPFEIGKSYLIRTVTHIDVGRVTAIIGDFVELEDASWIADTGRYHDCLKTGVFNEVEPYPAGTAVNCTAIIDRAPWPHALPKEQK